MLAPTACGGNHSLSDSGSDAGRGTAARIPGDSPQIQWTRARWIAPPGPRCCSPDCPAGNYFPDFSRRSSRAVSVKPGRRWARSSGAIGVVTENSLRGVNRPLVRRMSLMICLYRSGLLSSWKEGPRLSLCLTLRIPLPGVSRVAGPSGPPVLPAPLPLGTRGKSGTATGPVHSSTPPAPGGPRTDPAPPHPSSPRPRPPPPVHLPPTLPLDPCRAGSCIASCHPYGWDAGRIQGVAGRRGGTRRAGSPAGRGRSCPAVRPFIPGGGTSARMETRRRTGP